MKFRSLMTPLLMLIYLGIAILITFPLILNLSGQLIGHHTGDAFEMGHHIWWFKYALQNGEPLFYQTLMAYPDGLQGVSLWANPLQFFPAWLFAFFMPVAAAYNVAILLTMALNGWAMYWLSWHLIQRTQHPPCTQSDTDETIPAFYAPALVAGVVFMAFPIFQGHLFGGHAGLLVMWAVPLLIYALLELMDTCSLRWLIVSIVFFLLSPSGHSLQTIYVLMPIMGLFLLWRASLRDWVGARNVVIVGAVGVVLLGAFLFPVFSDTFADDTYTGDQGYVTFSTDLLGLITPSFEHQVFGQLDYTHRVLGINITEGFTYIGIVGLLLSIVAVWNFKQARWWLALAVLTAILALGPLLKLFDQALLIRVGEYESYLAMPWAWIYNLPGFSLARTPGRFSFAFALAIASLSGYGMVMIWRWSGRLRWFITVALIAFILWEYQGFFPYPSVPADVPDAISALQERDDIRAVMDMPWGNLLAAKEGLYLQTWHQQALIAGQVTRRTPVDPAKLTLLEQRLSPDHLDNAGVDVIILHKQYASDELRQRLDDRMGAPTFEDERYALYDVPEPKLIPYFESSIVERQAVINDRYDMYFYTPEYAWAFIRMQAEAENRVVNVLLNGQQVQTLTIDGEQVIELRVPLSEVGYHTLTFQLEPACPVHFNEALTCRDVIFSDIDIYAQGIESFGISEFLPPVQMGGGITLENALVYEIVEENAVEVTLHWSFAEARSDQDIRFIPVLDMDGQPIAQVDNSTGAHQAGDHLLETVRIELPDDFSGDYEVYAGWYALPDVVRYEVFGEGKRAQDNLIHLGEIGSN